MELIGVFVSMVIAACITSYIQFSKSNQSTKSDEKPDHYQSIIIFVIVSLVSYMLFILITDSKDNTNVYNNIKIGDPPF